MAMDRLVPPAEPPVELAQLRAHLRLEEGEEDGHLQQCLDVAVAQFDGDDGELGLALVRQQWQQSYHHVPSAGGSVELILGPVTAVEQVEVFTPAGSWDAVASPELFELGGRFYVRARSWPRPGRCALPLRVRYQTGFGAAADVPKPICHAILLFAAHLYQAREPVVFEGTPAEVPLSIARLIAPFKSWWR